MRSCCGGTELDNHCRFLRRARTSSSPCPSRGTTLMLQTMDKAGCHRWCCFGAISRAATNVLSTSHGCSVYSNGRFAIAPSNQPVLMISEHLRQPSRASSTSWASIATWSKRPSKELYGHRHDPLRGGSIDGSRHSTRPTEWRCLVAWLVEKRLWVRR